MGQPIGVCREGREAPCSPFTVHRFTSSAAEQRVSLAILATRVAETVDGGRKTVNFVELIRLDSGYTRHIDLELRVSGDSRVNTRSTTWDELSESTSERPTR
jgi:hypothetical protein